MKIDKPVPVETLRADYRDLAEQWLGAGEGTRADFDALVRRLCDARHKGTTSHRPVDLVAAARFIALSRKVPGYRLWFEEWQKACTAT
jgi:hypothetical protein